MKATRVREGQIPSASTGEIYSLVEYSDGGITCTCRFGMQRGLMAAGDKNCKHAKVFRRTPGGGLALEGQNVRLSPTFSVADLTGDTHSISARVVLLLAAAFAPMAYLEDVTGAILQEDDKEREKQAKGKKAAPLTEEQRVIVEYLRENFRAWVNSHLSTDDPDGANEPLLKTAEAITRLALKHRPRTEVNEDNSETAKWLIYFLQHGHKIHDTALSIKDLGIRDVGPKTARLLAQAYTSLDALYCASEEDLKAVNEIGPIMATKIATGLTESKTRPAKPDSNPGPCQL